ncbi:MAG: aldo/keto reductase [Alphaproteobacteria bacterium]|nr:aldo/keto reductase [Alphaproteobacteria bacterium]
MNKKLSNGLSIPNMGFGTYQMVGQECYESVIQAIKAGYRLIDTAEGYKNEKEVGCAIKKCIQEGIIKREDVYVVTKLNPHKKIGYEETIALIKQSLEDLDIGYIDLFLIHWPNVTPDDRWKRLNAASWRAMEEFYEQGKIKSLGVSNFLEHHLDELYKTAKIKPVVTQLNLSPTWPQKRTVAFCREQGMQLMAWSPRVRIEKWNEKTMTEVSQKYGKSCAQISIRWSIQKGFIPLVKSSHIERMKENLDVFNFEISDENMLRLDDLLCHPANFDATPDSVYNAWKHYLLIANMIHGKITKKYALFKLFGVLPIYKNKFYYNEKNELKKEKGYFLYCIPLLKKKYINQKRVKYYLFHFIYVGKCVVKMNPRHEINTLPIYDD